MTKPYSQDEFTQVIAEIRSFVGSRLQSVQCTETQLCLGFHRRVRDSRGCDSHERNSHGRNYNGEEVYLLFDMIRHAPRLYVFKESPLPKQRVPDLKPVGLFLKTHTLSGLLRAVHVAEEEGRAFAFEFLHSQKISYLKAWLYPADANLAVAVEKKRIFLLKPSENVSRFAPPSVEVNAGKTLSDDENKFEGTGFSLPFLMGEALKKQSAGSLKDAQSKKIVGPEQLEQKRKKRLEGLQLSFKNLPDPEQLNQLANQLLAGAPFNKIDPLLKEFDLKFPKQVAQKLFAKAKAIRLKQETLKQQIQNLSEVSILSNDPLLQLQNVKAQEFKKNPSQNKNASTYQTIKVDDSTEIRIGSNAKQNMDLLRQAKSWHLWLHVKDQPSAHGIVSVDRKKTEKTNWEGLFHRCALLYVDFLKKKAKQSKKDPREFDDVTILGCEVRYVKALPGDALGRVTFSNEKTFRIRC